MYDYSFEKSSAHVSPCREQHIQDDLMKWSLLGENDNDVRHVPSQ